MNTQVMSNGLVPIKALQFKNDFVHVMLSQQTFRSFPRNYNMNDTLCKQGQQHSAYMKGESHAQRLSAVLLLRLSSFPWPVTAQLTPAVLRVRGG